MNTARISLSKSSISPVDVARSLTSIPSAPSVLVRLATAVRQGSSLGEIARIVRLDPGLAAEILRARRDRRDSPQQSCFGLEDAINFLGAPYIFDLVSETSRIQILDHSLDVYGLATEDYWRLSAATALAAELLAELVGEDVDICFTTGLLHNVGMAAIASWAREHAPEMIFAHRAWPREYSNAEGLFLGFTHAEAGAVLLSSWDFPAAITEPIRAQYVPMRHGTYARRSCLLHTAKWLAAAVCSDDISPRLPENAVLDVLRIPTYELLKLVVEVRIRIGGVRNDLETAAA